MKRIFRYVLVVGLFFTIMLTFGMTSHLSAGPLPKTIVHGANPPGSLFYILGAGIAKVVSAHTPMKVEVFPQGGTVWYPMLESGEVHFGINVPGDILTAYMGESIYE